jgi:peptide/nickel transport system substrate-binding protein/oligopeptide transport system substrate-binding protein
MSILRIIFILSVITALALSAYTMSAVESDNGGRYTNSIGVLLPPDAAPPEQQVLNQFSEDRPYNEWFRTVYKGAAGKYLIAEPLTRTNQNFELRGGAAERWEVSENGLTWTFYIRPGLQWSDGHPLTAHDYVFSLRRGADPENAYDFGWYYQPIKNWTKVVARQVPTDSLKVWAADDLTLKITTESPTPHLPLLLTYSWVSPEHAVNKYGDAWSTRTETSVSSGPFMVTKWTKGHEMILEANPMYRGVDKPYLERIIYKMFNTTTPPQRLPAYEAGEIDIAEIESQAELARLLSDGRLEEQVHTWPNFWTHYLFYNTQEPPFNDRRVRLALSLAIDREALCRSALKGFAVPAYAMLPPGFPAYSGDTFKAMQGYNPERARRLLAEAGYPNGQGFPTVDMWLRNEPVMHRDAAEGLQALLKRNLNLNIEVRNVENKVFMDGLNNHTFLFGMVPYEFDFVDPSNLLGLWLSNGRHNWNNRAFDALMIEAGAEVRDPVRRIGLYQEAERLLVEDVGGVFLWHKQKAQLWKPYLKGSALEPDHMGYRSWRGDQVMSSSLTLYVAEE